jgi:N-acetylglucosamine-6-phosphate deacetylase
MMNSDTMKIITGATLIHPNGQQAEGSLLIEGNRIRAISQEAPGSLLLNQENVEVFSGAGCYLTPGLIELHFNGALGCNLNQTSITEVQSLLKKLPAFGITSVLFTLITGAMTDMLSAIHTLEEVMHHKNPYHCRPLGIHLEGPFINPAYRGTHPAHDIRPANPEDLNILFSPQTKMITLAPELDASGQLIPWLRQQGILVSIGHSNATYQQAIQSFQQGANSVTHLYNAMRPIHHREPGIIGAALCEDDIFVQFIADGAHVHPEAIRIMLKMKPRSRVLLTSDASPLAGLENGSKGSFSQQTVTVRGNQVINQEGGLAGSGKLINDCVKNMVQWQLCEFGDAIQYASFNPAIFLNEEAIGRLEPGCLADLVLWNKETLAVETTFINGEAVYQRNTALV